MRLTIIRVSVLALALLSAASLRTGVAHAFKPGPHQDPEALQLAKAADFALLQAVNEHRACVLAEQTLADDLVAMKAALAAKDAAALRPVVEGIQLRAPWVADLEERAQKSRAAVDAIDTRIHGRSMELGQLAFSGRATKADMARALDFSSLEIELSQDPDFHELFVNGDSRVFAAADLMNELVSLRPAVLAVLYPKAPIPAPKPN